MIEFFDNLVVCLKTVIICFFVACFTECLTIAYFKNKFRKFHDRFYMMRFKIFFTSTRHASIIIAFVNSTLPRKIFSSLFSYFFLTRLYFAKRLAFCDTNFVANRRVFFHTNSRLCITRTASLWFKRSCTENRPARYTMAHSTTFPVSVMTRWVLIILSCIRLFLPVLFRLPEIFSHRRKNVTIFWVSNKFIFSVCFRSFKKLFGNTTIICGARPTPSVPFSE